MKRIFNIFKIFTMLGLVFLVGAVDALDEIAFNRCWSFMQHRYVEISQKLDVDGYKFLENDYYHTHWMNAKNHVQALILSEPNVNFLNDPVINSTMVPRGKGVVQQYEISLLQDCLSKKVYDFISSYIEPDIGPQPKECIEFNCSTNALNKLSYAAKILELSGSHNFFVEFGSGYGCLAHILKQLIPDSTLILIDIPEFLALQYVYLQYSLSDCPIIFHKEVPCEFKAGVIHLVPTHYIKDLKFNADVFISTFAISESPACVQKIICDKKFFNAKMCYITGQLYGWNAKFEDHYLLISEARKIFDKVLCIPFYYTLGIVKSYELMGINI